jgi:glucose-6-phosphate 1-epimerase
MTGVVNSSASFRGQEAIQLTSPDGTSSVTVLLHGATIVSYILHSRELLFVSSEAVFEPPKAVRGGIPICFPNFGPAPPSTSLAQHGFARISRWSVVADSAHACDRGATVVLALTSSETTLALWPHEFTAKLTLILRNAGLELRFAVENRGATPLEFTFALHSYFAVNSVHSVVIRGLGALEFADNANGRAPGVQNEDELRIKGKIDRIYKATPSKLEISDSEHTVELQTTNAGNAVVWNPWDADAKKMADLGDDDWLRFVCVETAQVLPGGIKLAAHQRFEAVHSIRTIH